MVTSIPRDFDDMIEVCLTRFRRVKHDRISRQRIPRLRPVMLFLTPAVQDARNRDFAIRGARPRKIGRAASGKKNLHTKAASSAAAGLGSIPPPASCRGRSLP